MVYLHLVLKEKDACLCEAGKLEGEGGWEVNARRVPGIEGLRGVQGGGGRVGED